MFVGKVFIVDRYIVNNEKWFIIGIDRSIILDMNGRVIIWRIIVRCNLYICYFICQQLFWRYNGFLVEVFVINFCDYFGCIFFVY